MILSLTFKYITPVILIIGLFGQLASADETASTKSKNNDGVPQNILLAFTAKWAGPCQEMSPVISKLQRQGLPIRTVDIDTEKVLAIQFKIESLPCFIVVENGIEVTRLTGKTDERNLRELARKIPQQPRLTIEKMAHQPAVIDQPLVYTIIVKNTGSVDAHNVVIEDRIPKGTELMATAPRAELLETRLIWKQLVLKPNEEKKISIKVLPKHEGPIGSVARVYFGTEVSTENSANPAEKLRHTELDAETEANLIRQLPHNDPTLAEHQRKLRELLTTAFDLKLQLEELQVEELRTRLTRFENQISQRRQSREKIVAHRAADLVEKTDWQWESTEAEDQQTRPSRSKNNGESGASVGGRVENNPPVSPATIPGEKPPEGAVVIIFFGEAAATKLADKKKNENQQLPPKKNADLPERKELSFNFRYAPWSDVLNTFAEINDLTLDLNAVPPGTFNYTDDKEYTMSEALDVINGYLYQKGYILVRRDRFLACFNLDSPIPPELIPKVTEADLPWRGKNELLSLVLPVKEGLEADKILDEAKQLLGPMGKRTATALKSTNSLVLTDTGSHLLRLARLLRNVPIDARANPLKNLNAAEFPVKTRTENPSAKSEPFVARDDSVARTSPDAATEEAKSSSQTTQVYFAGPNEMEILIEGSPAIELTSPARHNFVRGSGRWPRFNLSFSNATGIPEGTHFSGQLDFAIFASTNTVKIQDFLSHNAVPLAISYEDVLLASNDILIKTFSLPKGTEPKDWRVQTYVTSMLDPSLGGMPVNDGDIVAILQLARDPNRLSGYTRPTRNQKDTPMTPQPEGRGPIVGNSFLPGGPNRPTGETALTVPTINEFREQLAPIIQRAKQAQEKARGLETAYYRDKSNASDLKQAIDDVTRARLELKSFLARFLPTMTRLYADNEIAKVIADAAEKQFEAAKQPGFGVLDETQLKRLRDAMVRAAENLAIAKRNINQLNEILASNSWTGGFGDDEASTDFSVPRAETEYPPPVTLAWLEATTELKLEFVKFDDLQLWFKAALRVREDSNEFHAGDLIVLLDRKRFDTLDQAVTTLKPFTRNGSRHPDFQILQGGLTGPRVALGLKQQSWPQDFLEPGRGDAIAGFEVRVRHEGSDELETKYVSGTCISPEGLFAITVSSKMLAPGEEIISFEGFRGTARVVASDDNHSISLVKLDSPNRSLFPWLKCHARLPVKNQRLKLWNSNVEGTVLQTGSNSAVPVVSSDEFIVRFTQQPGRGKIGSPVVTVDEELQGLIVENQIAEGAEAVGKEGRLLVIPAHHVEKLLNQYRKLGPQ